MHCLIGSSGELGPSPYDVPLRAAGHSHAVEAMEGAIVEVASKLFSKSKLLNGRLYHVTLAQMCPQAKFESLTWTARMTI